MSKRDAIVKQVSRVLCYKASSQYIDWCPFCENKGCKDQFAAVFKEEAEAVVDYFVDTGVIKKAKLIWTILKFE